MKASSIVWAIIVVILGIMGWYVYSSQNSLPVNAPVSGEQATVPTTASTTPTSPQVATDAPTTVTVTYGVNGFTPATATIAKGGTVTFVNQGSDEMWVGSDSHPAHQGYSGTIKLEHCPDTAKTAFDQCFAGKTYTFNFLKTGTWGYHNHVNPGDAGTVIVK